ncbi:branched-chain amino acid ABC transporter substrate-binding protein [Aquaspirillum serpens]|uniref:branched-chain amino acid ABC transporter substrate-binding protein n=1 Tax=Aquaspirillum serpens TaxID=190 RepID=UPI0003B48CD2|nr:branched-chain amino acid ABC transporter substrate-binding protein [Aquaspirillum serpens]
MKYARLSLIASAVLALSACGKSEAPKPAADAAAPAPVAAAPAEETTVLIGSVAPLTGPIAHLGKDNESGARLAVDEINAEGLTIGGKKVRLELVSEDDQADPKIATQVAQRLVDKKVVGVIGHLNSGTTIPASKIYADAGIPQISPSSTNPAYTQQGFKTAYRVVANDVQQGASLGNFAVESLKVKNVAVIDDRTAYGQGIADEFVKAAEAKGAKVVKREFTSNTATDFMAILTSIKAAKPDLVFFGGMDAQGGPLAKQMKKLGIEVKLLGADGIYSPEFLKLAGEAAEGHYASFIGMPRDQMPGFASFNEKFKAKYGEVQMYSPYAYDAVRVMVDAMKKADSVDPAAFAPKLAETEYAGVTSKVKFDDKGDLVNGAVTVYQVKDGKWETLQTVGGMK